MNPEYLFRRAGCGCIYLARSERNIDPFAESANVLKIKDCTREYDDPELMFNWGHVSLENLTNSEPVGPDETTKIIEGLSYMIRRGHDFLTIRALLNRSE